MKYAEKIKEKLNVIGHDVDLPVTDKVVGVMKRYLYQCFVGSKKADVSICFNPSFKQSTFRINKKSLVLPKKYYMSALEWLWNEGFIVDVPSSEIPNVYAAKCVKVSVTLK